MGGIWGQMAASFDADKNGWQDFTRNIYFGNRNRELGEDAFWLSSTQSIQNRVWDLKQAGLNPMLAYQNTNATPVQAGQGRSTPAPSAALGWSQLNLSSAQAAKTREEIKLIDAQKQNIDADTQVKLGTASKVPHEIDLSQSTAAMHRAQTMVLDTTIPKILDEVKAINKGIELTQSHIDLNKLSASQMKQVMPAIVQLAFDDAYRSSLGLPKHENMSGAERSWWKQNVAPYLNDILSIINSAKGTPAIPYQSK